MSSSPERLYRVLIRSLTAGIESDSLKVSSYPSLVARQMTLTLTDAFWLLPFRLKRRVKVPLRLIAEGKDSPPE